jgi:sporulation protein YlmC with PRC-barrel domain
MKTIDATIDLIDRTALDRDGVPLSAVDDVEIDFDADPPRIMTLVLASGLLTRVLWSHPARRRLYRVPWRQVGDLGAAVQLDVDREDTDITWLERWLRENLVGRIPGGRSAPR